MMYRLIYHRKGEQGNCWSLSYSWIIEKYILSQKYGYDVEIWEYNDQGSRLLERSLYDER